MGRSLSAGLASRALLGHFAELVTTEGGGFTVRLEQAYGHEVGYDAPRHDPDHVATMLADAGLRVTVRTERAAQDHEKTPQAFLLARRS